MTASCVPAHQHLLFEIPQRAAQLLWVQLHVSCQVLLLRTSEARASSACPEPFRAVVGTAARESLPGWTLGGSISRRELP